MCPGYQHKPGLGYPERYGRKADAKLRGKDSGQRTVGTRQQRYAGLLLPEETKETLVDGWLRTGDLGYVDEDNYIHLTGRLKNLIITKNGENVSPEELENKIGSARLVQEILVRDADGVIEAEIFPDMEYVQKKEISDIRGALQQLIDDYNKEAPAHKKVYSLKVRETEFDKTPSKKIKRY